MANGIVSTVLDCTQIPFRVLRQGAIESRIKEFMQKNRQVI
jgi:tRNA A37 threonylcarbamoyladenosine synthetase subunit TsaC/SUA5/YrdC